MFSAVFSAASEYLAKFSDSLPDLASGVALAQLIVCVSNKCEMSDVNKRHIRESQIPPLPLIYPPLLSCCMVVFRQAPSASASCRENIETTTENCSATHRTTYQCRTLQSASALSRITSRVVCVKINEYFGFRIYLMHCDDVIAALERVVTVAVPEIVDGGRDVCSNTLPLLTKCATTPLSHSFCRGSVACQGSSCVLQVHLSLVLPFVSQRTEQCRKEHRKRQEERRE